MCVVCGGVVVKVSALCISSDQNCREHGTLQNRTEWNSLARRFVQRLYGEARWRCGLRQRAVAQFFSARPPGGQRAPWDALVSPHTKLWGPSISPRRVLRDWGKRERETRNESQKEMWSSGVGG